MSVIKGNNAILYFKVDGYYRPVACMEAWSLTTDTELSETSTVQTGIFRTYRGHRNTYAVSCNGVCSFDTNHSLVKMRLLQKSFTVIPIAIVETDDNGIGSTFTGNVIITNATNDAAANDFDNYSLEATGTGEYTITDIPVDPNECCQDDWYYYTANGSEGFSITINSLIGKNISGRIYRDGVEYRPSGIDNDGTGAPVGKQFKFESVLGKISFDDTLPPLALGEQVDIPFNLCGSSALTCDIIIENVMISLPSSSTLELALLENLTARTVVFTFTGEPAEGDSVTVEFDIDLNDIDGIQHFEVTSTVQEGWGLNDLVIDLLNQITDINPNTFAYTDDGNSGVKIVAFSSATADVTVDNADVDAHFTLTFDPVVDGVTTVPDDVTIRYSTDGGDTWHIPDSITYDPDTNYNQVVINNDLPTDENYLFEITPVCNGVSGTPGTGFYYACINASFQAEPDMPDAILGESYVYGIALNGSAPFELIINDKPAWMNIEILGPSVHFTGTPDAEGTESVDIEVTNCTNGSLPFTDTFDVIAVLTPSIIIGNALCRSTGSCNDNAICGVNYSVSVDNAPAGSYIDVSGVFGPATISVSDSNPATGKITYTEPNGIGSTNFTLELKDSGGTVIASQFTTLSHQSFWQFLGTC